MCVFVFVCAINASLPAAGFLFMTGELTDTLRATVDCVTLLCYLHCLPVLVCHRVANLRCETR